MPIRESASPIKQPPIGVWTAAFALTALILILAAGSVSALTISPELRAKLEANGVLDEFNRKFARWHEQLADQQPAFNLNNILAKPTGVSAQKTIKVCVLLVDFSDNPVSAGSQSGITPAVVDNILFSQGVTPTGSMTDFYLESSYGQFLVDGDVFGWFRLPQTYAQYVGADNGLQTAEPNARTMARDAILTADPTVNFTPFDNDGDGFVEALIVIHAGPGAEETGNANQVWSHRWSTPSQVLTGEGKRIFNYLTAPEEVLGGPLRIGVYAHEFGHILGLPDLYDVGPEPSEPGLGNWSLMAGGSWNNGQKTPAQLDGWCKHVLDSLQGSFGKTIDVTGNLTDVILGAAVSDSIRYRLKIPGGSSREYFIIENRQQIGFDTNIPGSGLMILHCDEYLSGSNNMTVNGHWKISLEQADGANNLENNIGQGDAEDLFPGSLDNHFEWTSLTNPNTASWYNSPHEISVWNIRHNRVARTITCNLDVAYSRTNLLLQSSVFSDLISGNGNSVFDKGETIQVTYSFKNFWKTATGVTVKLMSTTPGISILNGTHNIGTVTSGQVVNSPNAMTFSIGAGINPTAASFALEIVSANPPDTFTTTFSKYVGGVEILLVDGDDALAVGDVAPFVRAALDTLLLPYAYWDLNTQGVPSATQFSYTYIIWFTGGVRANIADVMSPAEVTFLRNYLDQGGRLYLSGQDIAECLVATADSTFLRDYLGVRYVGDYEPLDAMGLAGNSISSDFKLRIRGPNGASNQIDCDLLDIVPAASHTFDLAGLAGARQGPGGSNFARSNDSRVVFTSFGVEAVTTNTGHLGYGTRMELLQRILSFLDDNVSTDADDIVEVRPLPFDFKLDQNYPNPFNPSTQISFTISPSAVGDPLLLEVFNILGQRVALLRDEVSQAGSQTVEFDAGNQPSGVYFYRLRVGTESVTRKMVLSK
ncbi:MAG: M6 family metalloprotease domain-containing protein [Candidatus Zixiibacteriota bacterium]